MSTDVRVVTFNAAAGNPKIKTVETEFLDLPFYREALEDAPGAPVLALQEVGSGQARALRERARGAPCQVLQKRRPGLGNALVVPARYRVLRARRRYFVLSQLRGTIDGLRWWAKEGHKPNWRQFGELRMWVEARVRDRVTEREFTVLTTHLSVEPSLKRRQAEQVVRRARRAARRGPVVLAGDFNVPANPRGRDVEIAAILGRLKDAGSAQPGRRPNIDYVLTDGFEPVSSKVWMGDSLSLPSSPTAELISDHYAEDDVLRFTVPRGARRGAGQVAFGARATIRRDRVDDVRTALAALAGPGAFATAFPFALMDGVHFGRLLIIDDELDPDGVLVPASLLYMSEVDAPLARHLQQLTTIAGPALDGVFSLCEGYPDAPDPAARLAFLEAAYLPAQARYVNTVGRTCRQVLDEAYLREAIQAFLDRERFDLPADVQGVRRAIQQFVVDEPSLAWARHRAPRPPLRFRVGEALHFLATVALLVVLTPLLAVVLPIWALVLRYHEARDPAPYVPVPAEHNAELFAIEDFVTQNQFNAIGWVKPGWFRRTTIDRGADGDRLRRAARVPARRSGRREVDPLRALDDARGRPPRDLHQLLRRQPRELHGRLHRQGRVRPQRVLQPRRRVPADAVPVLFRGQARGGVQGPPAQPPDPDAGLVLRVSAPVRPQRQRQRADPLRALRGHVGQGRRDLAAAAVGGR